jgi:hypothetical protein
LRCYLKMKENTEIEDSIFKKLLKDV